VAGLGLAAAARGLALDDLLTLVAFGGFALVGALLVAVRPGNRVGTVCLAIGLGSALASFSQSYALYAQRHAGLPAADLAAWLQAWLWYPTVGLAFTALPLLFPDGGLPSPAWRPVAVLSAVDLLGLSLAYAFGSGGGFLGIANPWAIAGADEAFIWLQRIFAVGLVAIAVLGVGALIDRYRAADHVGRLQLRWVAAAFACMAASLAVGVLVPQLDAFALVFPLLPISVGIAVLRYRLYQIDIIINRALVYIPLTMILGGLLAALIALFQKISVAITGDESDAAVIITTLIVAGVFTPIRKALDAEVDRRFKPTRAPGSATMPGGEGAVTAHVVDPGLRAEIEAIARAAARDELHAAADTGTGQPGN
jgi:hypothetical protein